MGVGMLRVSGKWEVGNLENGSFETSNHNLPRGLLSCNL